MHTNVIMSMHFVCQIMFTVIIRIIIITIIIKWKYHFCFGWNKTCSQNVSLVSVSYPASSKLKLSCPQWIELHGTEWCFMFFCSNAFSQVQNKNKNKRRRLSVHLYQYEVWSIRNINVYCFNSVVVACCSYSPFSASVMFIHTRWMFILWINVRMVVTGIIRVRRWIPCYVGNWCPGVLSPL